MISSRIIPDTVDLESKRPANVRVQLDRLTKERDAYKEELERIVITCEENSPPSCNQRMALDFIYQIARHALAQFKDTK